MRVRGNKIVAFTTDTVAVDSRPLDELSHAELEAIARNETNFALGEGALVNRREHAVLVLANRRNRAFYGSDCAPRASEGSRKTGATASLSFPAERSRGIPFSNRPTTVGDHLPWGTFCILLQACASTV